VEFVEGNFHRNQALQDRRIVLCERDRGGGLEGSRGSTGREALTAYLRMCGNNSIETAPQRTGPRMVEDPHACTLHSKTALLLATPPGYYPHKISKCLGSAIQGWRGVREWQRMPSCQTLCRCTRQDEALKQSVGQAREPIPSRQSHCEMNELFQTSSSVDRGGPSHPIPMIPSQ